MGEIANTDHGPWLSMKLLLLILQLLQHLLFVLLMLVMHSHLLVLLLGLLVDGVLLLGVLLLSEHSSLICDYTVVLQLILGIDSLQ